MASAFLARAMVINYNEHGFSSFFEFYGMQEPNQAMISGHSTPSSRLRVEPQKISEFLLQFHAELADSSDVETLVARGISQVFSFFKPLIVFFAYPTDEDSRHAELRWKSSADDNELPVVVRNLLLTGFDAVYPEITDSIPQYAGRPRVFVKSAADVRTKVLILAVFEDESDASLIRPIMPYMEQCLRMRLDHFHERSKTAEYESNMQDLVRTFETMIPQTKIEQIHERITEDACSILSAEGAAVLFPADETRNSYTVVFRCGFADSNIPLPNALFSKAFDDFEGQPSKAMVYHGGENEKFLLVPLLWQGEASGILFFYGNRPEFRVTKNRIKMAEIFGYRLSLAMANALNYQSAFDTQAQWENTFDSISDPIYIIDNEFRLKKINKSMSAAANREVDVPLDRNCYRYLFQRESVCTWCPVPKQQQTGEAVTVEERLFSGGLWQIQTFPYFNKAGERTGSIQILRDITLLKKIEEQLIETEKLASMGKLISGVAHEVRNPLFGISATARALKNELEGREDIKPFLDIITSETTRLNRLMEELLNYSRPLRIDKNPSDLAEIVQEVVLHFKQSPVGQHATINFIGSDRIPPINMDRNKMKQALINLVENGIQHSGDNPRIDIFLEFLSLVDPPQISLVIKDNGAGITPENLQRIFDPFFTTRQRGTGLGLSIVRKVIHDHGGRIAVESHQGHGTTFRLSLPFGSSQVCKRKY
jgi:signal transduction histidine kinase